MPKITKWVEEKVPFGEDNALVTVVTKVGFVRAWEKSQVTIDGRTVNGLLYETDFIRLWVHTDVVAFSGDNAVTVEEIGGDILSSCCGVPATVRRTIQNLRLSDGGNSVYTVEQIIEFALGKDALKWT